MNQSLPHIFRESVWNVDMYIVISHLKLSGKYVCTCFGIQELRTLPGCICTCVFHMIILDTNYIIFLKTLTGWSL